MLRRQIPRKRGGFHPVGRIRLGDWRGGGSRRSAGEWGRGGWFRREPRAARGWEGDLLAGGANHGDVGPHRDSLAFGDENGQQHPRVLGLDVDVDLIGLDLGNRLTLGHGIAGAFLPLKDLALRHCVAHLGHDDFGHRRTLLPQAPRPAASTHRLRAEILAQAYFRPSVFFTASMIAASCGTAASSSVRAYGIGTSAPVTRSIGASNWSKASS